MSESETSPPRPRTRWLWLASTLIALLLFGLLEGLLRITGLGSDAEQWQQDFLDAAQAFAAPCGPGPLASNSDQLRVIVVGESSARMLGQAMEQVAGHNPALQTLIHNCAQSGSSLPSVRARFDEALSYRPDLIILLFGNNVFNGAPPGPLRIALARLAMKSRVVALVAPEPSSSPFSSKRSRLRDFENWLEPAMRSAWEAGVQIQLSMPMGNPWVSPGYKHERLPRFMVQAWVQDALGHRDQAMAELARHDDAAAAFQRALWLDEGGEHEQAATLLWEARDRATAQPARAPTAVLELIRRTAQAHNIPLVDGERLLEEIAGDAPPWPWYLDSCHANHWVFGELANEHFRRLRPGVTVRSSEPRLRDLRSFNEIFYLILARDPESRFAQEHLLSLHAAVPQWIASEQTAPLLDEWLDSPFARDLDDARRSWLFAGLANGYLRAGMPERAADLYQQAPAPTGPYAATEWGLYLLRIGDIPGARTLVAPFARRAPARWFLRALQDSL